MKRIVPHIYLEGCKEALDYYQIVFGGEIKNIQLADEVEMFKGYEGKYIHAELHINESCIMYVANVFWETKQGTNIWFMIDAETESELNHMYQHLAKDGQIKMELQDTFWNAVCRSHR